jgi:hypothetical protein
MSSTDRRTKAGRSEYHEQHPLAAGGSQLTQQVREKRINSMSKQQAKKDGAAEITTTALDNEENLFELEIKNLDTDEIYTMHLPVSAENNNAVSQSSLIGQPGLKIGDPHYASKRKATGSGVGTTAQFVSNNSLFGANT